MAGRVTRKGLIVDLPELTAETKGQMLDAVVAAFIGLHPEAIQEAVDKYLSEEVSA